jgi:hypothetical protein
MKAIILRLRRLENAAAPAERERAAVEVILENRRRRLGSDYKPIEYPPDWFAGCRSAADRILRARQFMMEQPANGARHREEPTQNTFR